ncbi:MAG: ABC transporter substrate-binding protein, partial [Bacteroidota bacterium]
MNLINQLKNKLSRFLLFASLSCLCIFSDTQLNAQEGNKIRLQLKWNHQFQFAGFYAAQQKGFFKDAGLDVV